MAAVQVTRPTRFGADGAVAPDTLACPGTPKNSVDNPVLTPPFSIP